MLLKIISGMADRAQRYAYSLKLAEHFGCSKLLILIKDNEIDVLLPALGFPQTIPYIPQWKKFLNDTQVNNFFQAQLLNSADGNIEMATGIHINDGSVAILFGGCPDALELEPLLDMLPVLTSLFIQEQKTLVAQTRVQLSEFEVEKAEKLALTIDKMRAKLKATLVKQEKDKKVIEDLLVKKEEFINIASHELKTPITILKASLQLLSRIKHNSSEKMLPYLIEQSNKSMNKVSNLIQDLLNASRISHGPLQLNKTLFNISGIINDCFNYLQVENRHNLVIMGDRNLMVFADEPRIEQVVTNLITNAVKYAPDSLEILMVIETDDDLLKIKVIDKGLGINLEKQPYLFDRYYRADNSELHYSGLGLGLYICKDIIQRHNGEIGVESKLGEGSSFWFTIPFKM